MRRIVHILRTFILFILVVVFMSNYPKNAFAYDHNLDEWADKSFLIIHSTHNYKEARGVAEESSKKLGLELKLRDLLENSKIGLTFPKDICKDNDWEYPCYIARGRYDDGLYVSVEYSNAYSGFAEGLYIVIVLGDFKSSDQYLLETLRKAKMYYPDAYVKSTKVYLGCIH